MICFRRALSSLLLLAGSLSACAGSDPESGSVHFGVLFEEVARVTLEEAPDDPIVGITSIARRPEGGFVLTDAASSRISLFARDGRLEESLGGPGAGPGELEQPTSAVELPDGRVFVAQRANPRLTVFRPDEPPQVLRVPGLYASWLAPLGHSLVATVGTREERFAVLSLEGSTEATFGRLDPLVNDTPYWIFFARQHAAVLRETVVVNTSFFPVLAVYDAHGDSIGTIGAPPPSWVRPTPPPIARVEGPGDRARLEEWAGSFTVVRHVAPVGDSLLLVQYGRHRPIDGDPYFVDPTTVDVYAEDGRKLVEDVPFKGRIIGGDGELLVLVAEPPQPWTVAIYRWRAHD